MDMKEQQTQLFSAEDAQKLQPIMEDFMADCDIGNENWLANRLEQALPEESRENRQQIMEEIETGVEKFNSSLASLQDAIAVGDTKEEWLAENLRQSLNELSEKEYTALYDAITIPQTIYDAAKKYL